MMGNVNELEYFETVWCMQKPCEIILYIIIMNVSNFRKSEVTILSVVTRKVSMSVEHCHKNIEMLLLPVAIFSKLCSCQENSS